MKPYLEAVCIVVAVLSAAAASAEGAGPPLARPTALQYAWHEQERIQIQVSIDGGVS
jgi:hypothetical protein